MKLHNPEDIMKYAVNKENVDDKKPCLFTVMYFSKDNPSVSLLCESYITYFSRIGGTEEEKKHMAFYDLVCYLPAGWQEKIPIEFKYLYKLHDEFTESISFRIMKTRNEEVCNLFRGHIKPIETYDIPQIEVSTYTTRNEAEYEYSNAILNNKKPEE